MEGSQTGVNWACDVLSQAQGRRRGFRIKRRAKNIDHSRYIASLLSSCIRSTMKKAEVVNLIFYIPYYDFFKRKAKNSTALKFTTEPSHQIQPRKTQYNRR